jgi:hypothetical protein
MWKHYCKVERTAIMIGDDEKCNWCNQTSDNENHEFADTDNALNNDEIHKLKESIKIVGKKENEDGSINIEIDCSDEVIKLLIAEGMRETLEKAKATVSVPRVKVPFSFTVRGYELSDDEAQLLLQIGFIKAIEAGIEKEN